jgi:hypothetical protein
VAKKISRLPSKVANENLHFQRHTNFVIKLQCSIFSSATLFLEGSQLNFSSPKKKAGQNNRYDITKTLDLVEQECNIIY